MDEMCSLFRDDFFWIVDIVMNSLFPVKCIQI